MPLHNRHVERREILRQLSRLDERLADLGKEVAKVRHDQPRLAEHFDTVKATVIRLAEVLRSVIDPGSRHEP
jgi:hypothetical protein